ncbi:MAG: hypothetical protein HY815_11275 [Candidatus Riflebacteria bacterium]|nr:hypothetical protein [Candidatus Riflebacteria bacterium]
MSWRGRPGRGPSRVAALLVLLACVAGVGAEPVAEPLLVPGSWWHYCGADRNEIWIVDRVDRRPDRHDIRLKRVSWWFGRDPAISFEELRSDAQGIHPAPGSARSTELWWPSLHIPADRTKGTLQKGRDYRVGVLESEATVRVADGADGERPVTGAVLCRQLGPAARAASGGPFRQIDVVQPGVGLALRAPLVAAEIRLDEGFSLVDWAPGSVGRLWSIDALALTGKRPIHDRPLVDSPGVRPSGTLRTGEPLVILGAGTGWYRVARSPMGNDAARQGWVRADDVRVLSLEERLLDPGHRIREWRELQDEVLTTTRRALATAKTSREVRAHLAGRFLVLNRGPGRPTPSDVFHPGPTTHAGLRRAALELVERSMTLPPRFEGKILAELSLRGCDWIFLVHRPPVFCAVRVAPSGTGEVLQLLQRDG